LSVDRPALSVSQVNPRRQGEQSPDTDVSSVLKLTGSVPLNFEQDLKGVEALHTRFVDTLKQMTRADLQRKTVVSPFAQGARPDNSLLFSEIGHPTLHRGQIRTLRNFYHRTRGGAGLFAPKNPPPSR
jgi:hypothetical protein